jgi:DNA-binding winged helix-turn-helix (wHTH) protein
VAFVRWPLEAPRAYRLRELGLPRILLVEPDATPPIDPDTRQDWIRVPFDEADLLARVRTLELRCVDVERPRVPGDGRLTFAGKWISVSRINERLLEPLAENYGDVVPIDELVARGWPDGQGRTAMLRVHVVRLRRVIAELGLQLVGVRERGYVLEAADPRIGQAESALSGLGEPAT